MMADHHNFTLPKNDAICLGDRGQIFYWLPLTFLFICRQYFHYYEMNYIRHKIEALLIEPEKQNSVSDAHVNLSIKINNSSAKHNKTNLPITTTTTTDGTHSNHNFYNYTINSTTSSWNDDNTFNRNWKDRTQKLSKLKITNHGYSNSNECDSENFDCNCNCNYNYNCEHNYKSDMNHNRNDNREQYNYNIDNLGLLADYKSLTEKSSSQSVSSICDLLSNKSNNEKKDEKDATSFDNRKHGRNLKNNYKKVETNLNHSNTGQEQEEQEEQPNKQRKKKKKKQKQKKKQRYKQIPKIEKDKIVYESFVNRQEEYARFSDLQQVIENCHKMDVIPNEDYYNFNNNHNYIPGCNYDHNYNYNYNYSYNYDSYNYDCPSSVDTHNSEAARKITRQRNTYDTRPDDETADTNKKNKNQGTSDRNINDKKSGKTLLSMVNSDITIGIGIDPNSIDFSNSRVRKLVLKFDQRCMKHMCNWIELNEYCGKYSSTSQLTKDISQLILQFSHSKLEKVTYEFEYANKSKLSFFRVSTRFFEFLIILFGVISTVLQIIDIYIIIDQFVYWLSINDIQLSNATNKELWLCFLKFESLLFFHPSMKYIGLALWFIIRFKCKLSSFFTNLGVFYEQTFLQMYGLFTCIIPSIHLITSLIPVYMVGLGLYIWETFVLCLIYCMFTTLMSVIIFNIERKNKNRRKKYVLVKLICIFLILIAFLCYACVMSRDLFLGGYCLFNDVSYSKCLNMMINNNNCQSPVVFFWNCNDWESIVLTFSFWF